MSKISAASIFIYDYQRILNRIKYAITINERSLLDVFGDCFGSFRDSVSCEFSGEDELDSWLNFTGREGSSLVKSDELGSFSGNSVEGVMNEWVHDVHGLLGDSNVGVHLLEDLVDVDGEGLDSSSSGFSVSSGSCCRFSLSFFCHFKLIRDK